MAGHTKHHFVPQFYFRNFSGDARTINLLNLATGKVVHFAPIRGQAQRRNFYLFDQVESALSQLESQQSQALKAILLAAHKGDPAHFCNEQTLPWLWNFITIQRSRTPQQADKVAYTQERLTLACFKNYLRAQAEAIEHAQEILSAIKSGKVSLSMKRSSATLMSLQFAMPAALLISDLDVVVLRNLTDVPFVFSDSPVALFNQHLSLVSDRGTMGFQCPGLQIFVPISEWVTVMLIDAARYGGLFKGKNILDVVEKADIGFLNAFQVHNSKTNIYFGSCTSPEYVMSLFAAHKSSIRHDNCIYREYVPTVGDTRNGHRVEKVFHSFERQVNVHPKFSFIQCVPIDPSEYRFYRRNNELSMEFAQATGCTNKDSYDDGVTQPLRMADDDGNEIVLLPKQKNKPSPIEN